VGLWLLDSGGVLLGFGGVVVDIQVGGGGDGVVIGVTSGLPQPYSSSAGKHEDRKSALDLTHIND